jgi:hypothetical protein
VGDLASDPLSRRPKSRSPRHLMVRQALRVHHFLQNRPTLTRRPWKCLRLRPSLRRGSPHPPLLHLEDRGATARRYRTIRSHPQSFGRVA